MLSRKTNHLLVFSVLTAVFLSLASPRPALAQTITVCPDGASGENGCDYIGGDGIQEAVDAAPTGTADNQTIILIKSGSYSRQDFSEYINTDNKKRKCLINTREKNLVLQGEAGTVLDGAASANMTGICAKGGRLAIKNLDIAGFKKDYQSCFVNDATQPCSRGHGIQIEGDARVNIVNGSVYDNHKIGILVSNNAQVEITNSSVYDNHKTGILVSNNAQVEITNSSVYENELYGIEIYGDSQGGVKNSNIYKNNKSGIRTDNNAQVEITNSNIAFNYWDGIHGNGQSVVTITNANIYQNNGDNHGNGGGAVADNRATINLSYSLVIANRIHNWRTYDQGQINRGPGVANDHGSIGFVSDAPPIDFHLLPDSRAIDAGDPAILDPDGSRADTGAYGGPGACGWDSNRPGCANPSPSPSPSVSPTPAPLPPARLVQGRQVNDNGEVFDWCNTADAPRKDGSATDIQCGANYGGSYYAYPDSAGSHTISVPQKEGYRIGYTLCYNNVNCHQEEPTPGTSVTVEVPDDGYADLWWHYQPTATTATAGPTAPAGDCSCDSDTGRSAKQGGDFDCSGAVDINDFTFWVVKYIRQETLEQSLSCASSVSSLNDFNIWLTGYLNSSQ